MNTIARRAGFLKADGWIVSTDPTKPISFSYTGTQPPTPTPTPTQAGNYYIVIWQRNHLPVMSAGTVYIAGGTTTYDFTSSMGSAYTTSSSINPMVQLTGGKFGMYAGNGNGNMQIEASDLNDIWYPENGLLGYYGGDFNLDASVDSYDRNTFLAPNFLLMSQVPSPWLW
jgi:hypothetical protein